jgi:hypothetical protein
VKEALAEVGDFKIGGRINNKIRFADDMVNRYGATRYGE